VTQFVRGRAASRRSAEIWIVGAVTGAVLLTTHSVAILTVGEFARETGLRVGIGPYRRANLLDVTVCTWPFTLPYFLPAILAANATAAGAPFGMPHVSPRATGVHNRHILRRTVRPNHERGGDGERRGHRQHRPHGNPTARRRPGDVRGDRG
jgi:hypothetical protein